MASFCSCLLFSLLILISIINANSHASCPSFNCGNGVVISYPFWHQNQQSSTSEHCGYPGFNVSCNNRNAVFQLSDNLYHIRTINYSENSLVVSLSELKDPTCPTISHDFLLPADVSMSLFSSEAKMLRFFYNCSLYPPSLPSISCLQFNAKRSFAFILGTIPEFDWHRYCESIVTVPATRSNDNGFVRSLNEGFKLTWGQPDDACGSCESSGGFCGYRKSGLQRSFFCLCPDGKQYSFICHDKASIRFGPNHVAIGTLIFGSLIIGATVFYIIQRKRITANLYQPVSHRTSSSKKCLSCFV